ncbi:hypothetical protein RHGRI_010466 [Rhododendron griersonianum]|uniref:CCR4-NOT transcription complex subunit 1 TTP binding domain-containing protein n=1 Tax=Rhododendron griersonianum TaxID=479676 RepID=A0AAV6KJF5_9ERIC|nr:hypothetical protein RHGRI_010466 [Rhododendron griersonianum]
MFVFGTKALEQFVDRLIEWPSYCNHILQMSHLRSSHSELVAFIERALERISSGHSESDGGHNASMDLQHGSIQANAPNMEVYNCFWFSTPLLHIKSLLNISLMKSFIIWWYKIAVYCLIFMPKALSLEVPASDISVEVKQLLDLTFKVVQLSNRLDVIDKVISMIVSAASSCATHSCYCPAISQKQSLVGKSRNYGQSHFDYTEARNELFDMYNSLHHESGKLSSESVGDNMLFEYEADLATSKQLMDILQNYIHFDRASGIFRHPPLSKNKSVVLWLSAALLLCFGSESCFHFVNSGGMEQLRYIIIHDVQNSHAITLIVLEVVEQATRHSIGCEGFLGWWPCEDESIPLGTSLDYNKLFKLLFPMLLLLLQLIYFITCVFMRLLPDTSAIVVLFWQSSVLSALASLSTSGRVTNATVDKLTSARFQLKTLMKMINSRAPLEDPSPLACTSRSLLLGETEGVLSYKSTCSLITSSNCWFSNWDIDSHLLFLLKVCFCLESCYRSGINSWILQLCLLELLLKILSEICIELLQGTCPSPQQTSSASVRLPSLITMDWTLSLFNIPFRIAGEGILSFVSCTVVIYLEVSNGNAVDIFVDIASCLEAVNLSLLFCRSGLIFLHHPELSTNVILALRGSDGLKKEEPLPLRYASVLVNAIDRLLTSDAHSEEILWVLWELCALSRSHCGRQALLALGHFPEVVSVLIAALQSIKELDPDTSNSGFVPLNLAVFHSAAEIFEVIVTDLTASSLGSWIGNATELHRALNSSSPGSNGKDASAWLLEWVDASIVYHSKEACLILTSCLKNEGRKDGKTTAGRGCRHRKERPQKSSF